MSHYMVELPDGRTIGMDEEMLGLYRSGKWDPTKKAELTPEQRKDLDDLKAEMRNEILCSRKNNSTMHK